MTLPLFHNPSVISCQRQGLHDLSECYGQMASQTSKLPGSVTSRLNTSGEVDRLSTHRTTREALQEIGTFLYRLLLQEIFPNVMLFLISKHFRMSTQFFELRCVPAHHSELVDELILVLHFISSVTHWMPSAVTFRHGAPLKASVGQASCLSNNGQDARPTRQEVRPLGRSRPVSVPKNSQPYFGNPSLRFCVRPSICPPAARYRDQACDQRQFDGRLTRVDLVGPIYTPIIFAGSPSRPLPPLQRSRSHRCAAFPSILQEHNTSKAACANRGPQLRNQDKWRIFQRVSQSCRHSVIRPYRLLIILFVNQWEPMNCPTCCPDPAGTVRNFCNSVYGDCPPRSTITALLVPADSVGHVPLV
jgi:hypothetical protein